MLLLLMVSTNVLAFSLFGPKNFDECVLENMKGVSSDDASHIIVKTCRRKFSEKEIDNIQKNIDECVLENMKGVNSDEYRIQVTQYTFTKHLCLFSNYIQWTIGRCLF